MKEAKSETHMNDHLTPLPAKLRAKDRIKSVSLLNEKMVLYNYNDQKLVFDNLDLHKQGPSLVLEACEDCLNF